MTNLDDSSDHIDAILAAWHRERPDLDLSAIGVFGRIAQLTTLLGARVEVVFTRHGLTSADFDVLTTLRRSGAPYTLKPSQLSEMLMMSRAGITSRLDHLEQKGWVERSLDPSDRRSFLITLTAAGKAVIDATLTEHAENLIRLLSPLDDSGVQALEVGLRRLLAGITGPMRSAAVTETGQPGGHSS